MIISYKPESHNIRRTAAALLSVLLLPLSGCGVSLTREYRSVRPHVDRGDTVAGIPTVSDLDGLQAAMCAAVDRAETSFVVMLHSFTDEISDSVEAARRYVLEQYARGIYLLESVSYEQSRAVDDYFITFNYSYRLPKNLLDGVAVVGTLPGLSSEISSNLRSFGAPLLLELHGYADMEMGIADIYAAEYLRLPPDYAYGYAGVNIKLYPEQGDVQIAEITPYYYAENTVLQYMSARADTAAREAVRDYPGADTADLARMLYTSLLSGASTGEPPSTSDPLTDDQRVSYNSAYGPLVDGIGLPMGYAMAYKKLCDLAGVSCLVVGGYTDDGAYYWNNVYIEGDWYHIDVRAGLQTDSISYDRFMMTDEQAAEWGYSWND